MIESINLFRIQLRLEVGHPRTPVKHMRGNAKLRLCKNRLKGKERKEKHRKERNCRIRDYAIIRER